MLVTETRIQQLDAQVINRIAAGEVIERPASVVKELLENSVDALSTRIDIDIGGGGVDLIRISDNGEGMHPEDLELAVTSHATSKIQCDSDLAKVATMGFRGEALASIASISRFRIRTKRAEANTGQELESEGGVIRNHRECGCPSGTTIEVRNLFFNTPARRKFLKRPSTEFGRISDQFARIALAYPNLQMTLRHNEKVVYELPSTMDQLERIRRFFGSDFADKMIAVESETRVTDSETIRLWGYVGDPQLSKSTRKDQYLFLNGRYIQDRSLQHALGEAYRGLLMVGRHPVSFLFLEVPPHLVDVNVHPTKIEVRFQDSQTLYRQLLHTLKEKFRALDFHAEIQIPAGKVSGAIGNSAAQKELDVWARQASGDAGRDFLTAMPEDGEGTQAGTMAGSSGSAPKVFDSGFQSGGGGKSGTAGQDFNTEYSNQKSAAFHPAVIDALSVLPARLPVPTDEDALPPSGTEDPESVSTTPSAGTLSTGTPSSGAMHGDEFRAFQVHDCYLVVATDDGIEIIDQHALHERVMYEHLRTRVLNGGVERQKLLVPEPIECSAGEAAVLMEYQDLLKEIGYEIEDFGGTTILVSAHPVLLPRGNFVKILRDLAGKLEESDGKTSRRDLLDNMMHTMACRAAIKAGQRLAPEEMQELLKQRHSVQDSHHCPHGRPTSLNLSQMTLDKQFGRLG
ncbi:MAG: DNA mismatch repair endonuclease MutL [Fuerstiella sp.]